MQRRDFIALIGGAAAAWPIAARTQQPAIPVIGFLRSTSPEGTEHLLTAFHQGLKETGYVAGQNLAVEYRWADGHVDQLPALAADLVHRDVAVIVANGVAVRPAIAATATIPIVFVIGVDPVRSGFVTNLNRPGENVTGTSIAVGADLHAKRLEMTLRAHRVFHLVVEFDGDNSLGVFVHSWRRMATRQRRKATRSAAPEFGLQLADVQLRDQPYDYEKALAQVPANFRKVAIFPTSPVFFRDRQRLAEFGIQNKIATVFGFREWVDAGGLFSYGVNFPAMYRRAAEFVDIIAKGAKPADLPVEQPTKFELILNLKTAKAIGVTISPPILVRADEVIE